MSLLVKGGRLVDPASGTDEIMDIFIEGEKILKIGKNINLPAKKIIDATGSVVIPGLIDMHTHLRDPGREDEETIRSGTLAAARGGFTTICCMPNTSPVIDDPSLVHYILRRAEKEGVIEVLPIASITKNEEGKVLSEMGRLRRAGAVSFSDDGKWVSDAHLMRRALEYVKMLDLPLISHCEDDDLSKDGVINEGFFSTVLGLPGIPREAEEIAVFRDICLTRLARSSLHIAHISTVNSLNLVREAKKRGIKVTCEVTPHHFTLSEELVRSFDTNTKVNPPLRDKDDVRAMQEGLKDGSIEVIATDHAPHSPEEKELGYTLAPFGIIGLETALGLVIKELIKPGILTLSKAIAKLTVNPARILNLDRGRIREEGLANLAIFNLNEEWKVKKEDFLSLSKNSPFVGWTLPGKVKWTIFKGKVVYQC
ncbi:dihydroorotase [Candidatus Aerophobetes bacterium]|nr:dihydroorotase [Candidatus Aerophobetes bacterium]